VLTFRVGIQYAGFYCPVPLIVDASIHFEDLCEPVQIYLAKNLHSHPFHEWEYVVLLWLLRARDLAFKLILEPVFRTLTWTLEILAEFF
jgi:hypothetical protein